jgi:hypothetical protein
LLDEMPTSGLPEALPALLTADRPKTLGAMLRELCRRVDVTVTARPSALAAGARVMNKSEVCVNVGANAEFVGLLVASG